MNDVANAASMKDGNADVKPDERQRRIGSHDYRSIEIERCKQSFSDQYVLPHAWTKPSLGLPKEPQTSFSTSQLRSSKPLEEETTVLNPLPRRSCCGGEPLKQSNQVGASQKDNEDRNGLDLEDGSSCLNDSPSAHHVSYLPFEDLNFDLKTSSIPTKDIETWSQSSHSTTLYTTSPAHSTASNSLNSLHISQLHQGLNDFSQINSHCGVFCSERPAALSEDGGLMFSPAHNCNCGDTCSCLGCAAHPYNATTRHHVQDLGHILEEGYDGDHLQSRPTSSYGALDSMIDIHDMSTEVAPAVAEYPLLSSLANPHQIHDPTVNGGTEVSEFVGVNSNLHIEPIYSSSSYYTMEFPMDDGDLFIGCTDVSGSCQCGSDCACIGCLTHTGHDGDSLVNFSTMPDGPGQPVDALMKQEADITKLIDTSPSASSYV